MLTQLLFIMLLNHVSVATSCNELLQHFWDLKEIRAVSKSGHEALGKSGQQAVRRYYTYEGSLHKHCNWVKFQSGGHENFDLGHDVQVDQDQDIQTKHSAWREQIPLL